VAAALAALAVTRRRRRGARLHWRTV
jgi:hypothetical protein